MVPSTPATIEIQQDGTFEFDANLWHVQLLHGGGQPTVFPITARVQLNGQEIHYHPGYHEQWFCATDAHDANGVSVLQTNGFKAWRRSPSPTGQAFPCP